MATGRIVDRYIEDGILVVHVAMDGEFNADFGGGAKPTTLECRVELPMDFVQAATQTQIRAAIVADVRRQRLAFRSTMDRVSAPTLPATLTIPDS